MSDALLVIDLQRGFDDSTYWGHRDNPECERNVRALVDGWRAAGEPVVYVRHDSLEPGSPLGSGRRGNAFKDALSGEPDLLVTKNVNSAFHGQPDLAGWLHSNDIAAFTVCGIQTNMCCETTARVGSNLGFAMRFVLDATHTFDLLDRERTRIRAEELARVTAANLDPEFGRVVSTPEVLAEIPN